MAHVTGFGHESQVPAAGGDVLLLGRLQRQQQQSCMTLAMACLCLRGTGWCR